MRPVRQSRNLRKAQSASMPRCVFNQTSPHAANKHALSSSSVIPAGTSPRSSEGTCVLDGADFIYQFHASEPLPSVDLSRTLAHLLLSPTLHQVFLKLMRGHFQHFVMIYRVGVVDLGVLLFLPQSDARMWLSILMLPCTMSVFTSVFFMSTDLLSILTHCYEFWFLVLINLSNWIVLATILNDVRAVLCWCAWLSYQTIIMIDANYRTYPTALVSAIVSTPLVFAIASVVAAKSIRDGNYYELYVNTHRVSDASDLITFTTSTLCFFVGKMFVLKKRRTHRTFEGFESIPCVVIKSKIRLVPLTGTVTALRRRGIVNPEREQRPGRQQLLLCTPPLPSVDAFRTVLPHHIWKRALCWSARSRQIVRVTFYFVGSAGISLLSYVSLLAFKQDWQVGALHGRSQLQQSDASTGHTSTLTVVGSACSVIFCGGFALLYQRDLLRLLCRNFDFLFCVGQTFVFVVCDCDLMNWNFERSLTLATWSLWALWALTLDAATPIIKQRVFGFQKRWAAPVLASSIVGAGAIGLFILFLPGLGLRDRVLWSYEFSSSATFAVRTKSVLLGRVVTIHLWSTRQAFLLWTRHDDELNFIHGSVEYLSPYRCFPHVPASTVVAP